VSQIIRHPSYNEDTSDNDIALLQLSETVDFTDYIRPVCLAAEGSVFSDGQNSWVTGWGNTGFGGEDQLLTFVFFYPDYSHIQLSQTLLKSHKLIRS